MVEPQGTLMVVAVPFRCRSIIPARFLALLAHLTMLILVTTSRRYNIDSCLPYDFTEEEFRAKDWQLALGSYASLTLLALELAGFLSGLSMFMPSAALISIGTHISGTVALTYFIFDDWDCTLFWWVFAWCSCIPAAIELLNVVSAYIVRRSSILIELPERFRGTIVEKWAKYWKGMASDYAEVARGCVETAREKPLLAAGYAGGAVMFASAIRLNPPEQAYRSAVVQARDEVGLVAPTVRNPAALDYLNHLESLHNEQRVRHISFGILSLYWVADNSEESALPRAQCEFLQPAWLDWHKRVIEIAFWGRFWRMGAQLKDYDVNPAEWENV